VSNPTRLLGTGTNEQGGEREWAQAS
jgi:hypothetical protein